MQVVARAQRGAELRDVGGGHVGELTLPASAKHLGVPAQIPLVRLDGVSRKPALDHEVLQVLPHRVANANHAADITRGSAASCCYQRVVNYRVKFDVENGDKVLTIIGGASHLAVIT